MSTSITDRISVYQHKLVKRLGKRFLRKMGEFQSRHSLVSTEPFISQTSFKWTYELESNWQKIRQELDKVIRNPEDIPAFHQLSEDQTRISKGNNWKVFTFYVFGKRVDENCVICPETAKELGKIKNLQNAFFSILAPHYHIPAHKGPTRAIIRVHLGLIIPEQREKCWIRVHDKFTTWEEGKCIIFDDSYEHEVHNETDQLRVVLFLDFDRPMDRVGTWVNNLVVGLLRSSNYVKQPLKNLSVWNKQHNTK